MRRTTCDGCREDIPHRQEGNLPQSDYASDEVAPGADASVQVVVHGQDLCRKCIVAWLRRLWNV